MLDLLLQSRSGNGDVGEDGGRGAGAHSGDGGAGVRGCGGAVAGEGASAGAVKVSFH